MNPTQTRPQNLSNMRLIESSHLLQGIPDFLLLLPCVSKPLYAFLMSNKLPTCSANFAIFETTFYIYSVYVEFYILWYIYRETDAKNQINEKLIVQKKQYSKL
jgi:hypothetical protein